MNVPGHVGLTLAVFYVANTVHNIIISRRQIVAANSAVSASGKSGYSGKRTPVQWIDYRLVFLGSMLPDIIDKPLAFLLTPELVNHNTRSIGHSLTFNLVLLTIAVALLLRFHAHRPLTLALASGFHIFLDMMWEIPKTFFWPVYGLNFPLGSTTLEEWLTFQTSARWMDPPELIGLLMALLFMLQLLHRRSVGRFWRTGALS